MKINPGYEIRNMKYVFEEGGGEEHGNNTRKD